MRTAFCKAIRASSEFVQLAAARTLKNKENSRLLPSILATSIERLTILPDGCHLSPAERRVLSSAFTECTIAVAGLTDAQSPVPSRLGVIEVNLAEGTEVPDSASDLAQLTASEVYAATWLRHYVVLSLYMVA